MMKVILLLIVASATMAEPPPGIGLNLDISWPNDGLRSLLAGVSGLFGRLGRPGPPRSRVVYRGHNLPQAISGGSRLSSFEIIPTQRIHASHHVQPASVPINVQIPTSIISDSYGAPPSNTFRDPYAPVYPNSGVPESCANSGGYSGCSSSSGSNSGSSDHSSVSQPIRVVVSQPQTASIISTPITTLTQAIPVTTTTSVAGTPAFSTQTRDPLVALIGQQIASVSPVLSNPVAVAPEYQTFGTAQYVTPAYQPVTTSFAAPVTATYATGYAPSMAYGAPAPAIATFATAAPVATVAAAPAVATVAALPTYASGYETYSPAPAYAFGYNVNDYVTGDQKSHAEVSNGAGVVQGRYALVEPDGYLRTVTYSADDLNGFNAHVVRTPVA